MFRKIIQINETICMGCGKCAVVCFEGCIAMIRGKAILTNDLRCNGTGKCMFVCHKNAISLVTKEIADQKDE